MMRLLLDRLKPYRPQLALVSVLVLIQALANLYLPTLNADIIDNGIVTGDTGYIWRTGGLMLAVTFLVVICAIASTYFGSKVAMRFGSNVRSALFSKVESFSQVEVNKFGTSSLINRNTNDVQQVQMLIAMGLTFMLQAPLMSIGGIIMALRQDVPLSASLIVILPVMMGVVFLVVRKALPLFRSMQTKLDRINLVMRETLSGVRVIRAFVRSEHEERRFEEANQDITATALSVQRLFAVMMPAIMLIFNFSTVAIYYFGGRRVDAGGMQIGNLTAFVTYVMQILMAVMMATIMLAMVPRAAASGDRIEQVLDLEPSIHDPKHPKKPVYLNGKRGLVEFKDVEFRYPGAQDPVLHSISFSAPPGKTTAIVGSTGSGKSTLISLIPRFYDVTGGSIEVDGVDIREMDRADLWHGLGFVPQKAFLFSGTVASNLRYGDEQATDADLWHALDIAQGSEFVKDMPEGLESEIAQGGANVSGGQRQRLAIARALVKKPQVYVLDDSFSALDFATDSRLRAALKQDTAQASVFIVAQRVSTIMHADQIVVLDQGTIAGIGTHQELMDTCETYREIVYSQLTEEEVA